MDGDPDTAKKCRERAKEMRALVDRMPDKKSQTLLQSFALNYERLANAMDNTTESNTCGPIQNSKPALARASWRGVSGAPTHERASGTRPPFGRRGPPPDTFSG